MSFSIMEKLTDRVILTPDECVEVAELVKDLLRRLDAVTKERDDFQSQWLAERDDFTLCDTCGSYAESTDDTDGDGNPLGHIQCAQCSQIAALQSRLDAVRRWADKSCSDWPAIACEELGQILAAPSAPSEGEKPYHIQRFRQGRLLAEECEFTASSAEDAIEKARCSYSHIDSCRQDEYRVVERQENK